MVSTCKLCGQRIEPGETFVLEGAYPSESQIFSKTHFKNRTAPESYGKIYHKKCYESLTADDQRNKQNESARDHRDVLTDFQRK